MMLKDREAMHELNQQQVTVVLDTRSKLLLGEEIEGLKARLDKDSKTWLAIWERRLDPYKGLWTLMENLSPRENDPLDRRALATEFRKWYYTSGNALFLSWKAMDYYIIATNLLSRDASDIPDDVIRKAFSLLRTQMKIDMAVYTMSEGLAQVGDTSTSKDGVDASLSTKRQGEASSAM